MKNSNFFESVGCAVNGIKAACRSERNLRFHISIANLICFFAAFYGLGRAEWAALVLTIVSVISAELFNTAVEKAVDTATTEFSPRAKLSKDAAAGAALVTAIGALFIGVCLFGDFEKITYALKIIFTDMRALAAAAALAAADIVFLLRFKEKQKE